MCVVLVEGVTWGVVCLVVVPRSSAVVEEWWTLAGASAACACMLCVALCVHVQLCVACVIARAVFGRAWCAAAYACVCVACGSRARAGAVARDSGVPHV